MSYHPAAVVYVRCDRCGAPLEDDGDDGDDLTYFDSIDLARSYVADCADLWRLIGGRTICFCCWTGPGDAPVEATPIVGGEGVLAEAQADAITEETNHDQ